VAADSEPAIESERSVEVTDEADVLLLEQEPADPEPAQPAFEPNDAEPVEVEQFEQEPAEAETFEEQPVELEPSPPAPEAQEAAVDEHPIWDDRPSDMDEQPDEAQEEAACRVPFAWEEGPIADAEPDEIAELVLDENAGLADRLWAARETAETVKAGEGRTRASLYRALSLAYDFAIAAQQNPDEYAELLEESGVKQQARAPMTPIVKLVFGVDYDKARLTEFAAALAYAQRQEIELGGFKAFIEKQPGGLKALVAAERQARRPEPKPDTRGEAARARLRSAPTMSLEDLAVEEEFAVVITRRAADGSHEPVAIVEDEALVERAIRKAV
jgi:hypothetical protein